MYIFYFCNTHVASNANYIVLATSILLKHFSELTKQHFAIIVSL